MQQGVRDILVVIPPTDRAMIHLDMILTMVDRKHVVVYVPSFLGPTRLPVLRFRAGRAGLRAMPDLLTALAEAILRVEPIPCGGFRRTVQEREQWPSWCNFVAVRPGVVLDYGRNEHTYREMGHEGGYRIVDGIDFLTDFGDVEEDDRAVVVFEGSELVRGGGGARCMSLPVPWDRAW